MLYTSIRSVSNRFSQITSRITAISTTTTTSTTSTTTTNNQNRFHTRTTSLANFTHHPSSDASKLGEVVLVDKFGVDVLHEPLINKGSGFPMEERERLGLRGLVPPKVYEAHDPVIMKHQQERILLNLRNLRNPLNQYQFMTALQDRNEVLFYRVLVNYLNDIAPIIYTPTVGQACIHFSMLYRRARGMYFSTRDKGHMHAMVWNWPSHEVKVVVVTDGSRILGLGDLGANGMGIPIGKLSLYTACGGIHPSFCLPILLDVGTNNEKLLNDPLYIGMPHARLTGEAYMSYVDELMDAVRHRWPNALIQFEDFSNENAEPLLLRHAKKQLCFNDDIQGTGAVALAAVLSALRVTGQTEHDITKQRILIAGAGSAGLGVASSLKYGMMQQGLGETEAQKRFVITDVKGSLGQGRVPINDSQRKWIRDDFPDAQSIEQVVELFRPTVIIGLTGVGGLFTEKAIKTMSKYVDHPIVFPLSNPTDHAECTAEQAYAWSNGRAIVASGSPFKTVEYNGRTLYPSQANNMYCFPGIGLGAIASSARIVSPAMLYAASVALAHSTPHENIKMGKLFPDMMQIRNLVTPNIAAAVWKAAYSESNCAVPFPSSSDAHQAILQMMWEPEYGQLVAMKGRH